MRVPPQSESQKKVGGLREGVVDPSIAVGVSHWRGRRPRVSWVLVAGLDGSQPRRARPAGLVGTPRGGIAPRARRLGPALQCQRCLRSVRDR